MTERVDVVFDSGGVICKAYFYRPAGAVAPVPCVVMGHGFTGTRNLGLLAYAERFAEAGMAVLVFDYAHFGVSGGQPRQLIDINHQLDDYRAAISFARAHPSVDPDRVVLWGTSLSGGHVIVVAAGDPRIVAVISQIPFIGIEFRRSEQRSMRVTLQLVGAAVKDVVRGLLGRPPHLIPVFAKPGQVAVFTNPYDKSIIDVLAAHAPEWRNEVAARGLLPLLCYRPGVHATGLAMPLLVCVAEHDTAASPERAAAMAARAPHGQLRRYPIRHFDAYLGDWFEVMIDDQVAFLHSHLSPINRTAR